MKRALGLIILLGLTPLAQGAVGDLKAVSVDPGQALEQVSFQASSQDFTKPGGGATSKYPVVATLKAGDVVIKAALDSKSSTAETPDLIRLDLSGNGDFKGCPALPLKLQGSATMATRIGPMAIQARRDGKDLPIQVSGYYYSRGSYRYLLMRFGTALEGTCAFGGKAHRVRIVDGDGNFRCGDPVRMKVKDGKAVELALGDTLQVFRSDGKRIDQRLQLGHRVKVDGKWYDVKVSPDGSKVSASEANVQMGQVRVRREQQGVLLLGTKHHLMLSSAGAPVVTVPAGDYVLKAYGEYHKKSGARFGCSLDRSAPGALKVFTVSAGEVTDLAAGPPMTAGLDVKSSDGQVSFSLRLVESAGTTVRVLEIARGQRPDAPQIEVRDAAGKKVYDGKMRYG